MMKIEAKKAALRKEGLTVTEMIDDSSFVCRSNSGYRKVELSDSGNLTVDGKLVGWVGKFFN